MNGGDVDDIKAILLWAAATNLMGLLVVVYLLDQILEAVS